MSSIKKIRCFAGFTTSQDIHDSYEKYIPKNIDLDMFRQNHYYIFTTGDDYTHVIIINTIMPDISHIPKQNVIGFAHEPISFLPLNSTFINYAQKYIGKYFIGDNVKLPEPFIEGNCFLCYHEIPLSPNIYKSQFMSIMISQKSFAPGHKYRHQLVNAILQTKLPIDIYGRGCIYYSSLNDSRIKGNFEKYELYDKYQFTICIENYETNHYFSEKIINPLLMNITPIYLGCKNIDSYFPNMYWKLSGDVQTDILLLHDIFYNPAKYIIEIPMENVMEKVDLFQNLPYLFVN